MIDLPAQIGGPTLAVLSGLGLIVAVILFRSQRQVRAPSAASPLEAGDAVELVALIDERIDVLEQLLRQAQEQAARLEAIVKQAESLRAQNRPASAADRHTLGPVGQAARLAALRRVEPPADGAGAGRRYDDIYALADAGQTSAEIAGRVGSPVGEVELILGLRGRRY